MSADHVAKILAPQGRLRAAINFGNSVLAQRDSAGGPPRGVAIDLSREFARRLQVQLELVPYDAAGKVVDALTSDAWDVAFLAVDPKRLEQIVFSPPYVLIEGNFVVRKTSPIRSAKDVDRPGVRLAVGSGTAYELFLSRNLELAHLDRFPTTAIAFSHFIEDGYDVTAGVREVARSFVDSQPELLMLEDRFMVIEQAMAMPKRCRDAMHFMAQFIEELKASGFVADALKLSGQTAALAPPLRLS